MRSRRCKQSASICPSTSRYTVVYRIPIDLSLVQFVLEGMEESGSIGFERTLKSKREFLSDVEFVCISDNYWTGKKKPCLTYGLR